MLKKYKEFKRAVDSRNSWVNFCRHHFETACECNNKESTDFWGKSYLDARQERDSLLGGNIKYAVIYKLTHRK